MSNPIFQCGMAIYRRTRINPARLKSDELFALAEDTQEIDKELSEWFLIYAAHQEQIEKEKP